ncbi:MAG: reverse transcriptase family protein [Phycisphaeraceae bacterium]
MQSIYLLAGIDPLAKVCFVSCGIPFIVLVVVLVVGQKRGWFKPYNETFKAERKRAAKGLGMNIDALAERLDYSAQKLRNFSPSYRRASIPKKRGGRRTLDIPSAETKRLQRLILRKVLRNLNTHACATGFDPGVSVAHNAAMHVGQAVVIKLDIKDFFPSTTEARVEHYFRRIGYSVAAADVLTRIVTHNNSLPQGAPTSPRLSNLINHVLDSQIERYVLKHRGTYTRYADDITISYPEDWSKYVRGTVQQVRRVCRRHGYTVHTRKKLRIVRQHQQQRVTGLVVNDKVNLPREKRRWLRAVEHRLQTTGRASLTKEQLAGWKAYQQMIEQQTRTEYD